jgi:hypothetical protein
LAINRQEEEMDTNEKLKQIKRSFRLRMNGVAAQSMRQKGLDYHINWGLSLADIQELAAEYGKDYDLAIELWKENIRECKILATLLMPPEEMLPEVAELWMEQTPNVEIAEQAAFNLYQHMPAAAELAFRWIPSPNELYQLCGYHVLSRLFLQGREPNERGINEFLDQAVAALASQNLSLRKAVRQSLLRFANLGLVYERMARSATKVYDLFQPLN